VAHAHKFKVYRSRSPTNHVSFQLDDAQRKIERYHRRLERKMAQKIKLAEERLTRLEVRIKGYEDRIRDLDEQDDIRKQYQELSEAQNQFISAQKA
jgi:exonuclease VII large subunit